MHCGRGARVGGGLARTWHIVWGDSGSSPRCGAVLGLQEVGSLYVLGVALLVHKSPQLALLKCSAAARMACRRPSLR